MTDEKMANIVFEYLSGLKQRSANFKRIWGYVVKKKKISESEYPKMISHLHMEIIQDRRFMLSPNTGDWSLREDHTYNEYKKSTTKTSAVINLLDINNTEDEINDQDERKDFLKYDIESDEEL